MRDEGVTDDALNHARNQRMTFNQPQPLRRQRFLWYFLFRKKKVQSSFSKSNEFDNTNSIPMSHDGA
jgi:hypothetical protein